AQRPLRRRRRHEVGPEPRDEEPGMGGVVDAEPARVAPVEVPCLAEDRLPPVVVATALEPEIDHPAALVPVVGPPGERPRLLADVVLAVAIVRPEREQLHELAAVVLVRRAALVLVPGQPD